MSALTFSPASESRLKHMESLAESVTSSALELIAGKKDGTPRNAAFVTFNNLAATNSALQMTEERPFLMDTDEAARPEDLYWGNIGLSHARKQLGALLGLSLSVLLMLFWTVPVGFVATLSNLSALTEVFPTVGHYIETHPWLANLFAQLAPLFLVVVVAMLPIILKLISLLEGHPSLTAVEASLFAKLSWFTVRFVFHVYLCNLGTSCSRSPPCFDSALRFPSPANLPPRLLLFLFAFKKIRRSSKPSSCLPFPVVLPRRSKTS